MKTGLVLFFLCSLFSFNSFGQKASYCHQTIRLGYLDEVQLISNISSRHHLMVLGPKKTPVLHVFDESLKLLDIKELPVTIPGNCDIEILTFKNHYFLFTHQPRTSNYQLWKIDDRGNASDLSPLFYKLANSFFLDSNATVQINVDNNNFYLRTQVYYPTHNRLQISLIRADPMLNVLASDRINIPFDKENEQLQQLLILDEEHLLILKQLRNDVAENLLVVVKCNLKSGKMTATQFNLHYSLFSQPALYYNAVDSSIFIYAMVRESLMSQGNKRSVFMCKMNDSLEVVEPATLLKSPNLFFFFFGKRCKA